MCWLLCSLLYNKEYIEIGYIISNLFYTALSPYHKVKQKSACHTTPCIWHSLFTLRPVIWFRMTVQLTSLYSHWKVTCVPWTTCVCVYCRYRSHTNAQRDRAYNQCSIQLACTHAHTLTHTHTKNWTLTLGSGLGAPLPLLWRIINVRSCVVSELTHY